MNDFSRLEAKLAKLGQRSADERGPRRLTGASSEALLAKIVAEVDEIILPRRVTLTAPDGMALSFAVANRRLQAILSPLPTAATAAGALADTALEAGDDAALDTLRAALLAALDGTASLTVAAVRPSADQSFPGESGVPSGSLMRAWDISADDAAAADPAAMLSVFLDGLASEQATWIRIDGEDVTGQNGDTDAVQRLSDGLGDFLDSFLQKREALGLSDPAPTAVAYSGPDHAVILADHGAAKAVVSVPASEAMQAMIAWRSAVQSSD